MLMSAKINKLEKIVSELALDLEALIQEHDHYILDDEEGERFFSGLPIETLKESLYVTHNKPRERYSSKDLEHKFELRKLYMKTQDKLKQKESELMIAKIDELTKKINKIK